MNKNIKSWEDVVKLRGSEIELPYKFPKSKRQVALNACYKLQIIAEVFNEGWWPTWSNDMERKWLPYFQYTGSGWGLSLVPFRYVSAHLGSYFYYKDEATAKFVGENFLDVYVEWFTGEVKHEVKDCSVDKIISYAAKYKAYVTKNNLADDSNQLSISELIEFVEDVIIPEGIELVERCYNGNCLPH